MICVDASFDSKGNKTQIHDSFAGASICFLPFVPLFAVGVLYGKILMAVWPSDLSEK
jgi:hypothetical protein